MEMRDAVVHETYEWSNIWWDHAEDLCLPRVLLIGDSITQSYTNAVIENLKEIAHVDRLANSRGVNDPALYKELGYMLGEYRYKAIHFNNGLHGWHIPDDVYARGLTGMVQMLQRYGEGAKLIWANSTPLRVPENPSLLSKNNAMVVRRNPLAKQVMSEYGIPVNDLYSLVIDRPELDCGDGCHFNEEGQRLLGKAAADMLRQALESAK